MWNGGGSGGNGHHYPYYPGHHHHHHHPAMVPPNDPRYLAMLQQQQQQQQQAAYALGPPPPPHHPHLHPSDPRYAAAMAMANGHGHHRESSDDDDDDDDNSKPAAEYSDDEQHDADAENDSDSGGGSDDEDDDDEEEGDAQESVEDDNDDDDGFGHGGGGDEEEDDDEDEDNSDDSDDDNSEEPHVVASAQPRGKPEAMAKKLALAVRQQQILDQAQKQKEQEAAMKQAQDAMPLDSLVAHSTQAQETPSKPKAKSSGSKKKKSDGTPKKKSSSPKKSSSSARSRSNSIGSLGALVDLRDLPTMEEPTQPITEAQYKKLEEVMKQFCKVPLLAEFSRPVAVLHPELMAVYSKIIEHPIDLGKVCRRLRRRQYKSLRDIRLDTWRIFANCVKYHSHPNNKQAVPSFVSIALHLRDFFNDLWQEHMLPSDFPPPPPQPAGKSQKKPKDPHLRLRTALEQRAVDRKRRLVVSGLSVMNGNSLRSTAKALVRFVENGGRVDQLDNVSIWGEGVTLEDDDESDVEMIVEKLKNFAKTLQEMAEREEELGVDELDARIRECYISSDGLETLSAALKTKIASRLGRFVGQLIVPINEANCRGVSQSSVWGCMAAAVWSRESSKKPFWPALVLGIMAPQEQKEEWHAALTERNETRLPQKLKILLSAGKRRAEQAIKRQSLGQAEPQSYFLVEFLGTHEFIWVREADIVENFNPEEDPNKIPDVGKKKRMSRSSLEQVLKSENYAGAIEEAQWALEEFEMQLQDIGGEPEEAAVAEGHAEEGYSFTVLAQSDDEAEGDDHDDPSEEMLDFEECNELLATNGLLDFSAAGRKKRAQILKQQKMDAEKKKKALKAKKDKAEKAKKARDAKDKEKQKEKEKKQAQRDLEFRRRKRMREREKALKAMEKKNKRMKISEPSPGYRRLIFCKRERAEAIVNGYVKQTTDKGLYKSLSMGGSDKWIPSTVIDSNNLSGMALAFRAAAGLIPLPNPLTQGPGKRVIKPWDATKLRGMKTSDERCACLENQIELIEKEIQIVKSQKERRLKLLEIANQDVARMEETIATTFEAARSNPMLKRQKHWLAGTQPEAIKGKGKYSGKKKEPSLEESMHDKVNWDAASAESDSRLDEKQKMRPAVEVEAMDSNDDDDDDPMDEHVEEENQEQVTEQP